MMTNERSAARTGGVRAVALWLLVWPLLVPYHALGTGTWVPLVGQPANGVGLMLLLSDGTVLAASRVPALSSTFPPSGPSKGWYRLYPDPHGHYVAGLWTFAADMHDTRLYFSSAVLQDGRVLVAGAEYGSGSSTSEIYDPVADMWTQIPLPLSLLNPTLLAPGFTNNQAFSDSGCKILANGSVLVAPVLANTSKGTLIYNPVANTWSAGPTNIGSQNEASWVKLPDDSILTVDQGSTNSERFIPSLNRWIADKGLKVSLYDSNKEIGAALLLPNGKAFFVGATGKTAIYTPSGSTNLGEWVAGPDIPNGLIAADAPAVMMVNGKVLCAVSVGYTNAGPTSFYEYDFSSGPVGSFTKVSSPPFSPSRAGDSPFGDTMLALPDGTVLFSHNYGGGLGDGMFIYQPDGVPLASGKPTITGIMPNPNGSYHLTGTLFNGISEGAAYGDDAQMDSNYPLVRLTDALGDVFYARSHHWSSTGVMQVNKVVTTEFDLPSLLPPGVYSVAVVANGIASDTLALPHLVYVDKNNPCLTIDNLPGEFRSFALANPPPGLYYGTLDCLSITLDPPFPDRPPGYPPDWPWGINAVWTLFPNPPPGYPAGWPWPPVDPPPTTFGLGGPFRVLADAVASASPNDRIQIKQGHYNERLTINKRLTLGADSPVAIGEP